MQWLILPTKPLNWTMMYVGQTKVVPEIKRSVDCNTTENQLGNLFTNHYCNRVTGCWLSIYPLATRIDLQTGGGFPLKILSSGCFSTPKSRARLSALWVVQSKTEQNPCKAREESIPIFSANHSTSSSIHMSRGLLEFLAPGKHFSNSRDVSAICWKKVLPILTTYW